jgi:hypothetical protein
MRGSGRQTDQLVNYAKVQATAASDQADAAQQFSDTAEDINGRMSDAVDQLKAASENARRAINNASQDAQRALDFSIQTAELDRRAWLGVKGEKIITFEQDKQFEVRIELQNSGRMPAFHTRVVLNHSVQIGEWPRPCEIVLANVRGGGLGTVAPQSNRELTAQDNPEHFTTGIAHDDIVNGKKVLYVCGRIIYWITNNIVASKDRMYMPHQTTFCLEYDRIRKEFAICENDNETEMN